MATPARPLYDGLRAHAPALLAGADNPHDELLALVWGPRFDREHALDLMARQGLRLVGMGREMRRRDLAMPAVQRMQGTVAQPVAAGDAPSPAVEEPHVGLGPAVLLEERSAVQLEQAGGPQQRRRERQGGHDEGAVSGEPALHPTNRRETW